ncbi:hypothetical protein R50072_38050 [Simiduia litorea]|uniref:EF-Tu C-terminal domain-related protein n=1 Tax=Simiduia litorea TaxID=1435348 RepID=UPI0036F40134
MDKFEELSDYHLKAKVYVIEAEFGGRQSAISDGYRGQFFWHINGVSSTDWDARYVFEGGQINPGESGLCKIVVSDNLLMYSGGKFSKNQQFGIREGSRIVAVGVIINNKAKNA